MQMKDDNKTHLHLSEKSTPSNRRSSLYTCPETVFSDNTLSVSELKAYMIIRSLTDQAGFAYIPTERIAERASISKITATRSINKLTNKGYIFQIEKQGRTLMAANSQPCQAVRINAKKEI